MHIIWLGHAGFRFEIAGQVILLDPWLTGNPMFPEARRAEAVRGATAILVTHGHGDHAGDAPGIAKETGAPVCGTYDLMAHFEAVHGIAVTGFNKGGTIRLGEVSVTMVSATHSSSIPGREGPVYAGHEAGYMIAGEGRTIYVSGDTDVMADMACFEALHHPEIGILSCGGYYTMDQRRAAWAARTYFRFRTVIPCHYRTFPLLAQDASVLRAELPGVEIVEPEVLTPIAL
jgi:L-ascorbate metabolism protein UlaG (beta-lactamase superfamily)